jgi:hypothetical protein
VDGAEVVEVSATEVVEDLVTEVVDAVGSAVTVGVVGLVVTAVGGDADEAVTAVGGEVAEVVEAHAPAQSLSSREPRSHSIEHAIAIHAHIHCLHSSTPKMPHIRGPSHIMHITRIYYEHDVLFSFYSSSSRNTNL